MIVNFIRGAEKGWAKYDPDDGIFTWSYDGSNERVIDILEALENRKIFTEITTFEVDTDDELENVYDESSEPVPWEQQIEELALLLENQGFEILYLGE